MRTDRCRLPAFSIRQGKRLIDPGPSNPRRVHRDRTQCTRGNSGRHAAQPLRRHERQRQYAPRDICRAGHVCTFKESHFFLLSSPCSVAQIRITPLTGQRVKMPGPHLSRRRGGLGSPAGLGSLTFSEVHVASRPLTPPRGKYRLVSGRTAQLSDGPDPCRSTASAISSA